MTKQAMGPRHPKLASGSGSRGFKDNCLLVQDTRTHTHVHTHHTRYVLTYLHAQCRIIVLVLIPYVLIRSLMLSNLFN